MMYVIVGVMYMMYIYICMHISVHVFVCVCEREREREREGGGGERVTNLDNQKQLSWYIFSLVAPDQLYTWGCCCLLGCLLLI